MGADGRGRSRGIIDITRRRTGAGTEAGVVDQVVGIVIGIDPVLRGAGGAVGGDQPDEIVVAIVPGARRIEGGNPGLRGNGGDLAVEVAGRGEIGEFGAVLGGRRTRGSIWLTRYKVIQHRTRRPARLYRLPQVECR